MIRVEDTMNFNLADLYNVIIHKSASSPTGNAGGTIWYDNTNEIYKYYHATSGAFYPLAVTGNFLRSVSFDQIAGGTGTFKLYVVGTGSTFTYASGIINANQFFGSGTLPSAKGGLGTSAIVPSSVFFGQGIDQPVGMNVLFAYDQNKQHLGIGAGSPRAVLHLGTGFGPHIYLTPKTLEVSVIDNTIEYDGSGVYFSDNFGGRHPFATMDMSLTEAFIGILPIHKGGTNNNSFAQWGFVKSSGSTLLSMPGPTGLNAIPIQTTGDNRFLQGSTSGQVIAWGPTGWSVYHTLIPRTSGTLSMRQDSLADHSGVSFTTFASGQYLRHNGTNWINSSGTSVVAGTGIIVNYNDAGGIFTVHTSGAGGGAHALSSHTDTTITAPTNSGQFLRYNGSAWVNSTGILTAGEISDFNEATDDRVASLLVAGTGLSLIYNDASNTLTAHVTGIVHSTLVGLANDEHLNYVHLSNARTITAQHVFNPGSVQSPFILGNNTTGIFVTGLNADLLDGLNSSAFANASHTHTSTDITDFSEAVDDRVGTFIVGSTGVVVSYNDAGNALTIYTTGFTHGLITLNCNSHRIDTTNTETNFNSSGTLLHSMLGSGQFYRIKARGVYGTDAAVSTTLQFKVKANGIVIGDSTAKNNGLGLTNRGWFLEDEIAVLQTGPTGYFECQGTCFMSTSATAAGGCDMENTGVITINTTGNINFTISVTHQNSDVDNFATIRQFHIERLM